MSFPANCLVVAVGAALLGNRLGWMRNRSGRLHVFWITQRGEAFEFYRKGASRWPYWRLLVYCGEVRRAPALDTALFRFKNQQTIGMSAPFSKSADGFIVRKAPPA